MSNKQQIVIIGGGESWNTYDEYINYLTNKEYNPYDTYEGSWKHKLQDFLGHEYEVLYIKMPSRMNAKYNEWEIWFKKILYYLKGEIILIGHSLGANFLVKYITQNQIAIDIAQLHLVAGCYGARGGFELPNSLEKIEHQCKEIYIYHSMDDDIVDISDAQKYKEKLPKAQFIKFNNRYHFIQDEFPEIVQNIQKLHN